MEILLTKALRALVLPPGVNLLAAGLGLLLLLLRVWRRAAIVVLALALGSAYLFSVPVFARALMQSLETYPPLSPAQLSGRGAGAIVILSAGLYSPAPEYGGDTVAGSTLVRLRYGARVQRLTGLPILVTGGTVFGERTPLGAAMAAVLRDELGAAVRWTENESWNTFENAEKSAAILRAAGIGQVILVTHAAHMPRAVEAFERAGLKVTAAPTVFTTTPTGDRGVVDWLPSSSALDTTARALHEYAGRLWYRLRYYD